MSKETTSGLRPNNRQPRKRAFLRAREFERKRKRAVLELSLGASREEAAKGAGLTYLGLQEMLERRPEFKELVEEAETYARETAQGIIDGELAAIAKAEVKMALSGLADEATKSRSRLAMLRGRRVLEGDGTNVATPIGHQTINILVASEAGKELVGRLLSGGRTLPSPWEG